MGNFLPGRAVNHLPKKFSQVAQIFPKNSKRNEAHTMQQPRSYWHMNLTRYSFSGSIAPKIIEHKLRRHKPKHLEKLPPQLNPLWTRIHRLIWSTMIRVILDHWSWSGSSQRNAPLEKDENLSWSGLQLHWSCHSNEMTPLPILLTAIFLGTGNCSSKIVHGSFTFSSVFVNLKRNL